MEKLKRFGPDGLVDYGRRSFSSLMVRNYRLYFIGQGISLTGTWLQRVGQTWLMLELTHSGTALGVLAAAQFLPVLLFGAYGGLIADRFAKRRLLYMTQGASLLLALTLGVLVATGLVEVWMVFALAIMLGFVNLVDSPTRQTFIMEMVGPDRILSAVSLNSIEVNLARVIGPLVAAALIAGLGLKWCFFINAASYIAVLFCLARMSAAQLLASPLVAKARGQLRDGFRYIWATPVLRHVLLMMMLVGALSYEFQVVLPVFATKTFHGSAGAFAGMMAAMGAGSLLGGLVTAGRGRPNAHRLLVATLLFGSGMLLVSAAPSYLTALGLLVLVGFGSTGFTALTNSTLQLNTSPAMRGRVMSLWTVAFLGSTPIGGPVIGFISEQFSPRWGLATGGLAALLAAAFGVQAIRAGRRAPAHTLLQADM